MEKDDPKVIRVYDTSSIAQWRWFVYRGKPDFF